MIRRIPSLATLAASLALAGAVSAQTTTTTPSSTATPRGSMGAASGSMASPSGSMAAPRAPMGAASGSMAASGKVTAADQAFMKKAAIGGMSEVELGNIAQQKGRSDQVKQFGARMVQDHGKANDELKQIASTKGVVLPDGLDAKAKKDVAKFDKMSGAGFDKAFMTHMLADHKTDIAEFKKESASGKDADVKAFASKTLPTLQEHLQMAQAANSAVKKSK